MKNNGATRPGDGRKFLWKKNVIEKAAAESKDLPLVFGQPGRGMNFHLKKAIIYAVVQSAETLSTEDKAEAIVELMSTI